MTSSLCTVVVCIFLVSCGNMNLFISKSGNSASAPAPNPTVLPPVPVTGSYLTSILMDEFSKPIAQADVLADAGQFSTRTNEKGVLALPVRLVKDNAVELDVNIKGQTFFISVQLPVDIADAVRSVNPMAGTELPRTMGIRIADFQVSKRDASGTRSVADALSLPVQLVQSLTANTPLLRFAITSHKSGDVVQNPVNLSGTCDAGSPIRVTGDLADTLDTLCLSSGNQGIFDATVNLTQPEGSKSLTVTQMNSSTGEYVSQLLLLTSRHTPTAPTLTAANVSGLKPKLTGTCDSSATSHTVTTTVGSVRSVTCSSGVLTVEMRLPVGTIAFNVTVTSTNGNGSIQSGGVSYTSTSTSCPAGYIGVPASNIKGLGSVSASNGNSNWWLDTSLDFCMMKYPAKNNNGSTYATSTMTGLPWVSMVRGNDELTTGALKACKDAGSGYRLISNTQWQTVARNAESVAGNWTGNAVGSGVMSRGHTDNSPAIALENSTDNDPFFGTGNTAATSPIQRRTQTLSNGEVVWDFGGNVWQWVSDNYADLGLNPAIAPGWSEFSDSANFPTGSSIINRLLFAPLGLYNSNQNIGSLYGGSGGVIFRGGYWSNGFVGGLYTANLNGDPSYTTDSIGFRCVFLP